MEDKIKPEASIIIPSRDGYRDGNVPNLLKDLKKQDFNCFEIIIVINASPCGRAHNIGVKKASTENIIFMDDDVRLRDNNLVSKLVEFISKSEIGICGASQNIPPDSNRFQRQCAAQISRAEFPEVKEFTETDMATHACMAIKKETYEQTGGEPGEMFRNDDSYLRYKVKSKGLKTGVIPRAVVYHPMPENFLQFLKMNFNNGKYYSYDYQYYSEFILYNPTDEQEELEKSNFLRQVFRNFRILGKGIIKGEYIVFLGRISMWTGVLFGFFLKRSYFEKQKKEQNKIKKYFKKRKKLISF